jgi:hypothetical protein
MSTTTPTSGQIAMSDINLAEPSSAATAQISLNDAAVRSLAGGSDVTSGSTIKMSDLYGKTYYLSSWTYGSVASPLTTGTSGNGLLVFFENSTGIYTSPDGVTWTLHTGGQSIWSGVFGNGVFIGISSTGATQSSYRSTDGVNFSAGGTIPVSQSWFKRLYFGGGVFVGMPNSSTNGVYTYDGITWNTMSLPGGSTYTWGAAAYGNGTWVAITGNGQLVAATSTNGINWTQRTPAKYASNPVMKFGNGIFVLLDTNITTYQTTTDGINWTTHTTPITANQLSFADGYFIMSYASSGTISLSKDGINWSTQVISMTAFTFADAMTLPSGTGMFLPSSGAKYAIGT